MKGRKGKRAFNELSIYDAVTRASLKAHPKATYQEVDDKIADALKHAPARLKSKRKERVEEAVDEDRAAAPE